MIVWTDFLLQCKSSVRSCCWHSSREGEPGCKHFLFRSLAPTAAADFPSDLKRLLCARAGICELYPPNSVSSFPPILSSPILLLLSFGTLKDKKRWTTKHPGKKLRGLCRSSLVAERRLTLPFVCGAVKAAVWLLLYITQCVRRSSSWAASLLTAQLKPDFYWDIS